MNDAKKVDDGGPVYPQSIDPSGVCGGITRRDWLAGLAMPAIASHWTLIQGTFTASEEDLIKIRERIAEGAYALADALIAEGNKD